MLATRLSQFSITIKTSSPPTLPLSLPTMPLMFSIPSSTNLFKVTTVQSCNFLVYTFRSTASLPLSCFLAYLRILAKPNPLLTPCSNWSYFRFCPTRQRQLAAYPVFIFSFLTKRILILLRKLMYPAKTLCFPAFLTATGSL